MQMGDGSVLLISFLRALMMQTWNAGEQQGGMCSYSFMEWKCWMKKASCTAHSAVTGCKRITPSCIGIAFLWRKKIGRLTSNGSHFENSENIACCSTYILYIVPMNESAAGPKGKCVFFMANSDGAPKYGLVLSKAEFPEVLSLSALRSETIKHKTVKDLFLCIFRRSTVIFMNWVNQDTTINFSRIFNAVDSLLTWTWS